MTIFLEEIDLASLFADISTTIQPLMAKNLNTFIMRECPAIQSIRTDVKKLSQILYNLLNNASKFTQRGLITLEIQRDQDPAWMVISISDTGIGMSPEEVGRLFQEFTQADQSTTKRYSGTGLGLALCRRFTELLGGQIRVESEVGKGSTFHVKLPLLSGTASHLPAWSESPTASENRGTILVIDDDFTMRDALSRLLTKAKFWVAVATNGVDGLKMAHSLHPDVITLDVLMPGIDGWEVLAQLKADPLLKGIPVILISIVDEHQKGIALGATATLQKPIDRVDLVKILARTCGEEAQSPILLVEDDPLAREGTQRILEEVGYKVVACGDGQEALGTLSHLHPSVVLLDLLMPGMDGFQFVSDLRACEAWQDIPVIVLTAKELTQEDLVRLHTPHVQAVLRKGTVSKGDLVETVKSLATRCLNQTVGE
jgi:CheY-like chemotaxis protein